MSSFMIACPFIVVKLREIGIYALASQAKIFGGRDHSVSVEK